MQIEVNDQFDKSTDEAHIIDNIVYYLTRAERMGLVVTVERRALAPLAMGNHAPVVDVRRARELAK
jgi:hypothetical protein